MASAAGSIDAILDRLYLVYGDLRASLPGIKRAFRLPPSYPLSPDDVPCLFSLWGGLTRPIPHTASGSVVKPRQFVTRLLIAPLAAGSMDINAEGWDALGDAANYADAILHHFVDHPRLQTDAAPAQTALQWLAEDLLVQDSGPVPLPGPGGAQYVGIDFTLTLTMRRVTRGIA